MAEVNVAVDVQSHRLQAWKEHAEDRPLRLLVCGQGGAGKSTLINKLLGRDCAEEGVVGKPTTSVVTMYERTTERGIKVCIFDTPGFGDVDFSEKKVVAKILNETKAKIQCKLDLVIFCVSLAGSSPRLQRADVEAMKVYTQAFTRQVWKKAIVVLTCANIFTENPRHDADNYKAVVEAIKENVVDALQKSGVSKEITSELPIVTAGHANPILKYEEEDGAWDERLFLKALEKVDPAIAPALFQCRWSWADVQPLPVATAQGSGIVFAGGVGAAIGTGIGVVGGPVGMGIGAAVGGAAGTVVGAITGAASGMLLIRRKEVATILQIQYERLKDKKRNES